ncbi:MAG: YbaN family protein [Acidimicrobiia bacterium]|nr:YbaN family protein [Acidimicrobiia bacterium]NNC74051.1 YbaN family protein [Acidimicrobiia bacterium]
MPAARSENLEVDASLPEVNVSRSVVVRVLYATLGFAFLGLGIAGTFIPGIPGFLNLLVALWLFSMSSERMHTWMLENKYFGQSLRDYKAGLGIPRRIKVIAVTSITVAVTLSVTFAITNIYARIGLIALGLYGIWFVLSRPTREVEVARRQEMAEAIPGR